MKNALNNSQRVAAITMDDEMVFFSCQHCTSPSFVFRYKLHWAVASLASVHKIADDIKRLASRANLVCVQYPAELQQPFENAGSPLFYSRNVVVSYNNNMDYFCHLMNALFFCVEECEGGFVSYTDADMKEFVQINHGKRSVRVIDIAHKNGEKGIVRIRSTV